MLAILKKVPWWGWVGIGVAILVVWQGVTGAATVKSLYHQALDLLRSDQSKVVKTLEENAKIYEREIAKLNGQIEAIQKEKAKLAADKARSDMEIARLNGRINALQDELDKIVVSNDPDLVIKSLQRRFPSIRRR